MVMDVGQTQAHAEYSAAIAAAEAGYAPYGAAIVDAHAALAEYDRGRRRLLRAVEDAYEAAEEPARTYATAREAAMLTFQAALATEQGAAELAG